MVGKRILKGLFLSLGIIFLWVGRHIVLPVLVRIYRFIVRLRRSLAPAERRFVLIATHRGILHGAIVAVALTTAGGNIYAQTQATVSSGEQSILYRFITGEDEINQESGSDANIDPNYLADAVDVNSGETSVDGGIDYNNTDQGSETMIELGALMPEAVPGTSDIVHRTKTEEYVVETGDTLSDIANKFGVSIATILWENKLTVRDFIKPGQKLTILPSSGITYTTKSGDTIAKIAVANGVDPSEIKSWNNIVDETSLQKGQTLFIPGGKITPPPAPKPKPKPVASPVQVFTRPPAAVDSGDADMTWPADTHFISQPFGIWSRVSGGTHSGVDLAASIGTAIYAADDGIVTHAGCGTSCKKSYGLYIDIDHGNGIATRYGHTSKLLVKVGEQVRRGQVIALMGSTGRSTGPHLHFEVRVNGRYTNPMPYIR